MSGSRYYFVITINSKILFQGEVIESFCPFLSGANLCAFQKKDGGIRPIVGGCIFLRLAEKLAAIMCEIK